MLCRGVEVDGKERGLELSCHRVGWGLRLCGGGGSHVPCGPHLCAFFLECRFYAMIQMETLF